MKTVESLDLKGQKVLIRVDFNVPLDDNLDITDDLRIRTVLPTIRYVLEQGGKVILCSHLGRPKGEVVDRFSLKPVADYLDNLLAEKVILAPDCVGEEVSDLTGNMAEGEIVLLENLRFHPEEQACEPEFARHLASLADIYINDAFAVSHRAHASVVGVPEYVKKKGAGLLLKKELDYFNDAVESPKRPLAVLIGGAKISSKLAAMANMLGKVDMLLIGGAMANTFLKSLGYELGNSLVEDDMLTEAENLLKEAENKGVKVYLPVDLVVADEFSAAAEHKEVSVQDVPTDWMALDIGSSSVNLFRDALFSAKTIIWNGPMGAFEMEHFSQGTKAMAECLGSSSALTITGGGDSNAAVRQFGQADNISYMSTGGGAFLKLMEGKDLAGVAALKA